MGIASSNSTKYIMTTSPNSPAIPIIAPSAESKNPEEIALSLSTEQVKQMDEITLERLPMNFEFLRYWLDRHWSTIGCSSVRH
jgi:hypothetical protein